MNKENTSARQEVGAALAALVVSVIVGPSWVPWVRVVVPLILIAGLPVACLVGGSGWVAGGLGTTVIGFFAATGYSCLRKRRKARQRDQRELPS